MSWRNTGGQTLNHKEVTVGTELFADLDHYQSSWFTPWTASGRPRPSVYPKHQGFMTQLLATRLKHDRKAVFTPAKIYSSIFWTESSAPSLRSLLAYTLTCTCAEVERLIETCADEASIFSALLRSSAVGGEGRSSQRQRNSLTVNLTPFTPFKSPFSSESRVKITLWLRLWSWKKTQNWIINWAEQLTDKKKVQRHWFWIKMRIFRRFSCQQIPWRDKNKQWTALTNKLFQSSTVPWSTTLWTWHFILTYFHIHRPAAVNTHYYLV